MKKRISDIVGYCKGCEAKVDFYYNQETKIYICNNNHRYTSKEIFDASVATLNSGENIE